MLGDRRDVGQHLHDLVEQVGDAPAVDRRHRVGLAEAEVPQGRGLGLLAGVVDLVGDEEDGLACLAQQSHDVLVGRCGADHRIDDEQHDVREVDRDLGLKGDRPVDASGVGFPAAGVDQREPAIHPLGLVRHAVARDAGGVLDDGFTATEDAVDQRGLADVRATHDRHDGQRGEELDPVLTAHEPLEEFSVLLVEVVVLEADAQSRGALLGEVVVERGEVLCQMVFAGVLELVEVGVVVSGHLGLLSEAGRPPARRPNGTARRG